MSLFATASNRISQPIESPYVLGVFASNGGRAILLCIELNASND